MQWLRELTFVLHFDETYCFHLIPPQNHQIAGRGYARSLKGLKVQVIDFSKTKFSLATKLWQLSETRWLIMNKKLCSWLRRLRRSWLRQRASWDRCLGSYSRLFLCWLIVIAKENRNFQLFSSRILFVSADFAPFALFSNSFSYSTYQAAAPTRSRMPSSAITEQRTCLRWPRSGSKLVEPSAPLPTCMHRQAAVTMRLQTMLTLRIALKRW